MRVTSVLNRFRRRDQGHADHARDLRALIRLQQDVVELRDDLTEVVQLITAMQVRVDELASTKGEIPESVMNKLRLRIVQLEGLVGSLID